MTKDNIIDILKRKKKEAIKYSNEWANKPASNSQDKLMNECWSSWNDGQAKAFELAISIVSMLYNPHNRSSENKQRITMAKIKSYTDIEQSKKLAEILPLESADMWWAWYSNPLSNGHYDNFPMFCKPVCNPDESVPCWSLAALIDVLPDESDIVKGKVDVVDDKYMCTVCIKEELVTAFSNNPIDACYEMILKLHELILL